MNRDAPVGAKTRASVEAAIAALGYVPSRAARMMRSNRSGIMGLITGAISTAPGAQPTGLPDIFIVQGIQKVMAEAGLTLMIADTGGRPDRVEPLVQTFLQHRVEGLIFVADHHRKVSLPDIPGDTPLVLANCFDDRGTPAVLPDDRRGQFDLVQRLIAAGHRRIAYLALRASMVAAQLRTEGYRAALEAAGIAFDPALLASCTPEDRDDDTELVALAVDRMLALPDPPTVFACGNDKMALAVYGILRTRGIRVPGDVSVAGYDNYRVIAETLYPPLTTVDLPYAEMGMRAARRLLGLISGEGRDETGPAIVPGPVIWRGSVTEPGKTAD